MEKGIIHEQKQRKIYKKKNNKTYVVTVLSAPKAKDTFDKKARKDLMAEVQSDEFKSENSNV